MLSSKDGVFDKARGRMVGAQDYLTKPFTKDQLCCMPSAGRAVLQGVA
jgi:twitching motility two-component system response regulator PilG